MYSRVRASGLANGCPYQPSTTCGPETPSPRISRPPRQVVERHRGHRGRGRRARGDLHDRGAELDPLGRRAPPRERHQRVGAVRLGRPDRVEPEPLGLRAPTRRRPAAAHPPSSRCSVRVADRAPSRRNPTGCAAASSALASPAVHRLGGRGCVRSATPLVVGRRPGLAGPRSRSRCGRGGGGSESPSGSEQHVLAERRQVVAAERAAVRRGLAVLRPAYRPPAGSRAASPLSTRMASRRDRYRRAPMEHREEPIVVETERYRITGIAAVAARRLSQPPDRLPERLRAHVPRR